MSSGEAASAAGEEKASRGKRSKGGNGAIATGGKKSGASVTELELAFAKDPKSDAYLPLCEAYLDAGRFMEAMVVCKKGIKAHPDSLEAKILLARVYARQKKTARALTEINKIVESNGDNAEALLWRGKIKVEGGDVDGAVDDLKKAVDLDGDLSEASEILAEHGIEYPERAPPPPPPPPPAPVAAPPQPGLGAAPPPMPQGVPPLPQTPPPMGYGAPNPGSVGAYAPADPQTGSAGFQTPMPRPAATPFPTPPGVMPPRVQRLEGEEELEEMARDMASRQKEKHGNPKTTLYLLVTCVVVVLVAVGWALHNKRVKEGIDNLSKEARPEFYSDTYGGYKRAAELYAEIIDDYDSKHARTLGRYAMTLAILYGEHDDVDRKKVMEAVVGYAEKYAKDQPETHAAKALRTLYESDDQLAAAKAAYEPLNTFVKEADARQEPPSFAHVTRGILDLYLGNYETALTDLRHTEMAMPQSARARYWYATAAFRTGRLSQAENEYTRTLKMAEEHGAARAQRALVRIRRGNLEGAAYDVQKFEEFAQKNPKAISNPDRALILYARSETLRSAGSETHAEIAYEEAVKLDPKNAEFPYGLGRWMLLNGRPKQALKPLQKAVSLEPNRIAFVIALARAQAMTGHVDAAEKKLAEIKAKDPQNIEAALAQVEILRAQGKSPESFLNEAMKWSNKAVPIRLELAKHYRASGDTKRALKTLEETIGVLGGSVPQDEQGQVFLEYGDLKLEQGEVGTARNSFKQAANNGALDAYFKLATILLNSDNKKDREEGKAACEQYLNAGTSLKYTVEAKRMCG